MGGDRLTTELEIDEGDATRELHRAVVAQQLLHRVGDQVRFGVQRGELIGVAQQREGAVPDEVHRRLVSREVEEHHLVLQLGGGEPVTFLLGRDERAEQVIAGFPTLPLDRRLHVPGEMLTGVEDRREVLRQHDRLEGLDQRVRPLPHLVPVGLRHAEHLGDHREGQRERQVADHVHPAVGLHPVQHLVDQRLDALVEGFDPPGGERLLGQAPDPGVVGRVEVQDGPGASFAALVAGGFDHRGAGIKRRVLVLDRHPGFPQDPGAVLVAGDRPRPDRVVVHRRLLAQDPILGVGILEVAGGERIQPDVGGSFGVRAGHVGHTVECTDGPPARPPGRQFAGFPSRRAPGRLHSLLLSQQPHRPHSGSGRGAP